MKRFHRGLVALAAVATCGTATQLPADAAQDVTPPSLTTPLKAQFIIGSQLSQFSTAGEFFYTVPQLIDWTGSDDSGQVYYEVWRYLAGSDPERLVDFTEETEATVSSSDYDDQFGGGSFATTNWGVVAKDFSGNSTGRAVYGSAVIVTQDDGSQTLDHETDDVAVSYVGTWKNGACGCFAAGTTKRTTQLRAKATIHIDVSADEGRRAVALVMETAPNRGQARVFLDGTPSGLIDTFAETARHRVVVWARVLPPGSHTLEVYNLATAGRPRIDLDAVVVNAAAP